MAGPDDMTIPMLHEIRAEIASFRNEAMRQFDSIALSFNRMAEEQEETHRLIVGRIASKRALLFKLRSQRLDLEAPK